VVEELPLGMGEGEDLGIVGKPRLGMGSMEGTFSGALGKFAIIGGKFTT